MAFSNTFRAAISIVLSLANCKEPAEGDGRSGNDLAGMGFSSQFTRAAAPSVPAETDEWTL